MPINTLTMNNENVSPLSGMTLFGKLRKGAPKPENEGGKLTDLDYFRVTFEPQLEHLMDAFTSLYGDKPTEFSPVYLTGATPDEAFPTWKEQWGKSGLVRRCDGVHIVRHWNELAQMYVTAKIPCLSPINLATGAPDSVNCECYKPSSNIGRLEVVLPEFCELVGINGKFIAETHSINDIVTVYGQLRYIHFTQGTLLWIPFVFGRATQTKTVPRQKKVKGEYVVDGRIQVEKSLFFIHTTQDFTRQVALPRMMAQAALPAETPPPEFEISVDDVAKKLAPPPVERRLAAVEVSYDVNAVLDTTSYLFATPDDQTAFLEKYKPLRPSMTTEEAVEAVKQAVAFANIPGRSMNWSEDAKTSTRFVTEAQKKLGINLGGVMDALQAACDYPVKTLADFQGTKEYAWAALIAFKYNYEIGTFPELTPEMFKLVETVIAQHALQAG